MSSKIVKTLRPYQKTPIKPLILLAFLVLKALKTLLRPPRLLQNCYKKKECIHHVHTLKCLSYTSTFLRISSMQSTHTCSPSYSYNVSASSLHLLQYRCGTFLLGQASPMQGYDGVAHPQHSSS